MKYLFVFSMVVLLSFCNTFSQDLNKKQSQSEIEGFTSQDGILLQKEFIDVGEFKKCKINIAIFTDLLANISKKGIRFEYEVKGKYSNDTKIAFLDVDEIDALIKSITIIKENVLPQIKNNYTEIQYTSRGGFIAGCYWSDKSWTGFMKIEKYDKDSYMWFKSTEFDQLLTVLNNAKLKL